MLQRLALWMLRRYRGSGGGQRWFGVECNFEPSCSAYAEAVIARFGLLLGLRLTCNRLRRCQQPDCVCRCHEPPPSTHEDAQFTLGFRR